jgi:hypothetical protein
VKGPAEDVRCPIQFFMSSAPFAMNAVVLDTLPAFCRRVPLRALIPLARFDYLWIFGSPQEMTVDLGAPLLSLDTALV